MMLCTIAADKGRRVSLVSFGKSQAGIGFLILCGSHRSWRFVVLDPRTLVLLQWSDAQVAGLHALAPRRFLHGDLVTDLGFSMATFWSECSLCAVSDVG
jgi:hypothetical protein